MSERCEHGKAMDNPCIECDEKRSGQESAFVPAPGSPAAEWEPCWICGKNDPPPQVHVVVNCEKIGGEITDERQVLVHFWCYQDMDA